MVSLLAKRRNQQASRNKRNRKHFEERDGSPEERSAYNWVTRRICKLYGINVTALHARTTHPQHAVSHARALVVYLCHIKLGMQGPVLARFAHLDRATISQAIKRVEDQRDDPLFDQILDLIEEAIGHKFPEFKATYVTPGRKAGTDTNANANNGDDQ